MPKEAMQVITLRGPIAVTYRQDGPDILATALEFDLVGIGKTREAALGELQEIFSEYANEVLNTRGKVRFFNPAPPEEWDNPDKEFFNVTFILSGRAPRPSFVRDIRDIHPLRRSLKTIQLQQCCV